MPNITADHFSNNLLTLATYLEAFSSQFLSKLSQALLKTQLPQRFDWAAFVVERCMIVG
ncbi:MAG: hypothetical protein V7K42_13830 [Nostoc sp.]